MVATTGHKTAQPLRTTQINELVELYGAGATVQELAKQFRIHRATVGRYLQARGIDTKPRALADEDVPTAAELYRTGWSLAKIASHFQVSAHTISNHLLAFGVVLRGRHERVG
jgi:transposase